MSENAPPIFDVPIFNPANFSLSVLEDVNGTATAFPDLNNLTRRRADGTQINIPEASFVNVKFQTLSSAGLLDYEDATGIFTNNTGRTLIARVSVSLKLQIPNVLSGSRNFRLFKNNTVQAVDTNSLSSTSSGGAQQDSTCLSMTFDIDDGDTIRAVIFYGDGGTVNKGRVEPETQISIFCF